MRRTLAERWRSLMLWCGGLVAIAVVQLAVYPSVASSAQGMQQFVDQWPEAFRTAFNLDAYTTAAGFLNAEMFSMMIPLVLIAVAVGGAAAATAGEEERGTADLLFALPVSRFGVLAAKATATVVSVALVGVAVSVSLMVGAPIADLDVTAGNLVAGVGMVALLAVMFGAFALMVGAVTGHRAAALGAGLGLAIAAFLLNLLAPMADWLEPWQKASPFFWASDGNPLVNGMDWPMAALLAGLALAFFALAAELLSRRDIASR